MPVAVSTSEASGAWCNGQWWGRCVPCLLHAPSPVRRARYHNTLQWVINGERKCNTKIETLQLNHNGTRGLGKVHTDYAAAFSMIIRRQTAFGDTDATEKGPAFIRTITAARIISQ